MRVSKATKPAAAVTANGLREGFFDRKNFQASFPTDENQPGRFLKHGRRRIVAWCAVPA